MDTYPIPEGASGLAYDGTHLYCGIYGAWVGVTGTIKVGGIGVAISCSTE